MRNFQIFAQKCCKKAAENSKNEHWGKKYKGTLSQINTTQQNLNETAYGSPENRYSIHGTKSFFYQNIQFIQKKHRKTAPFVMEKQEILNRISPFGTRTAQKITKIHKIT